MALSVLEGKDSECVVFGLFFLPQFVKNNN